jgi:sec-independent protein translocase protein TatA
MFPIAMLGPSEIWPIAIIILVLFGAQRLPAMARSMGEGIKEFKKGIKEVSADDDEPQTVADKSAD